MYNKYLDLPKTENQVFWDDESVECAIKSCVKNRSLLSQVLTTTFPGLNEPISRNKRSNNKIAENVTIIDWY